MVEKSYDCDLISTDKPRLGSIELEWRCKYGDA